MPTLTSTTTVSSPLPSSIRTRTSTRRPRSPNSSSGQGGCGRPLDRVAGWVVGGIAAAFFASLERCSCVNLRTHDDDLDDERSDSEAPLMFDVDGSGNGKAAPVVGRRRGGGGSRRNEKGMRSGRRVGGGGGAGGMGYYADLNVS